MQTSLRRDSISKLALLTALLSTSGCLLFSGRCIYELRNVITRGVITENGAETFNAELIVGEQRDHEPDKDFHWQITGATMVGHVQSISFVDKNAKSTVLYELPLFTGQQPAFLISSGAVRQSGGAKLNGFFDILAKGRGLLIVRTDLPGKAVIEVPLPVESYQDWSRPYCS
jgi:hypothetical protein